MRGKGSPVAHIGRIVPGFEFKQPVVEFGELAIRQVPAQQTESLTRTSFNQTGDQQSVDSPLRFELPYQVVQLAAVVAWFQATETNPSRGEHLQHLMEMLEFLIHNARHFPAEFFIFDVGEDQIHGCTGRFLLAVRMVDQHHIQVLLHLAQPTHRRFRLQTQHESHHTAKRSFAASGPRKLGRGGPDPATGERPAPLIRLRPGTPIVACSFGPVVLICPT